MKLALILLLNLLSSTVMADDKPQVAIFAGGCFWCMEPPFDKLDGVISTTSGYISGHQKNPLRKPNAGTWTYQALEDFFNSRLL